MKFAFDLGMNICANSEAKSQSFVQNLILHPIKKLRTSFLANAGVTEL